jgi:3-oxoacyl-[acyl-carrier-protein] synthase II
MSGLLAITGAGCISAFGIGAAALIEALCAGLTGVRPVASFGTSSLRSHSAAEIHGFDPAEFIAPAKLRRIDRTGRLAVASTGLALAQAGLREAADVDRERIAIALGSQTVGIFSLVDYLDRLNAQGAAGASALDFSNTVGNAAASLCAIEYQLLGPNITVTSKEASSLAALYSAAGLIAGGEADAVVTGGFEDVEATYFAVHENFGVLARDAGHGEVSRPFDRRRNGFVIGSGAFAVVVEPFEAAERRGARRIGTIAGLAAGSAPCRLNGWPQDPAPLARCMHEALDRAGASPQDVVGVFASANSTVELDRMEADAITSVFGAHRVPVTSLKGALGECGSVGIAGVLAAAAALSGGSIPPIAGFAEPDPACPIDVVTHARAVNRASGGVALVNSVASGGALFCAAVRG